MKVTVKYNKKGEIITYNNVTLCGKFPNLAEGIKNKGFQVLNENNEPRRFCYGNVISVEAE